MASSSSAIDPYNNYDVFLSFRGGDTRNNFTSHLYKALCLNNINAFIDNKIDRGDEITPALERVIEAVKLSIIVFSSDYVSSTFCLDELVKIIECKESKSQIVLPIFYKVEPSKITYQEGFAKHETMEPEMKAKRWYTFFCDALFLPSKQSHKKHEEETIKLGMKVEKWRLAFHKALELAGWHIDDNSVEAEIIEKITEEVRKKLDSCLPKGEELMCTSMVGQTAEDNFKKIWECLMDNHISRVGLYGMGGVGKTTIATRINDQLLATINSFSRVCWVTVSKDLSIYNMQNKIAEMIKLDFSNEDDEWKRAAKLRKRLKNEKFVLILDDVWVAFEIEDVGIPPLVDGKKLFMTSRSRRACERMECLPIEVKPLSEQEALNLFIKESKYQINGSLEWGNIVNSIVKECAGLPLAIVVVARRMKGAVKIWEWRNTLQELQKPVEGENLEMEKKVFKILKFSYDCLSNDKYRHCFLYCSLFPEDHLFERKDLIDYWIGEGLIDETYSKQAQFDKGNVILDELIDASLLEIDDHWERIKMHDVIRDMAHINVKVGLHSKDSFESVQVLKVLKSFPNSTLHCSKLKTLLLQGFYMGNLPVCFFANMQRLVVLHISRVKSIPNSITNLGNLRVLTINECDSLECIPSLAGLEKLWHLNISWNRRLKEIPKDIELLVNLRVLDLSDNWSLDGLFPSGVVEKLSHLQTLNLKGTMVEVEAEALIRLEKLEVLKVHFYNLQKLNCYIQSGHWQRLLKYHINYGEQIVENWEKEMYSKIMSFKAIRDAEEWKEEFAMFLPYDIQFLKLVEWDSPMFHHLKNQNFVNLQSIKISEYKSRYLFTFDLAQRLLHNVQHLQIDFCAELEEIIGREEEWVKPSNYINYPTILLPNLKTLKLAFLGKLRSIYRGMMVCPSLEFIKIYDCNNIMRFPFCMEKEANKQNPTIQLGSTFVSEFMLRKWWDSLQWDDLNVKSMYLPIFESQRDSQPKNECSIDPTTWGDYDFLLRSNMWK